MTIYRQVFQEFVCFIMLAGLSGAGNLWAQAPNSISYSGQLTNAQGEPREGSFPMTFRIYDRPVGGTLLQQPPQTINNVVVRKGQFSVLLGPFSNNVFREGGGERYVEVQVGTEPPLLPRQQIVSAPFAQRAVSADVAQRAASADLAQRTASIDRATGGWITGNLGINGDLHVGGEGGQRNGTLGFGGVIGSITNWSDIRMYSTCCGYTSPDNAGIIFFPRNGGALFRGSVSKAAGSFKIDHPLDPANKYLSHSFVESPDMMNIYNGDVILDAHGEAWVPLPEWFEALNRDFRYQLTAVGAPGLNLYIAEEISGNRFKIAGGTARGKVSWQVTGIRQDAYANAHRIPVEEKKSALEQGFYLHPDVFGQPEEKGIAGVRHPELVRQLKGEKEYLQFPQK